MNSKLTQEEKRIRIAQRLGARIWENPTNKGPSKLWSIACPSPSLIFESLDLSEGSLLPNYFGDLNAMQEAVMSLPLKQWDNYELELAVVAFGPHMRHTVRYQHFATTNATAAQRAEAFGLALNIWEAGQ